MPVGAVSPAGRATRVSTTRSASHSSYKCIALAHTARIVATIALVYAFGVPTPAAPSVAQWPSIGLARLLFWRLQHRYRQRGERLLDGETQMQPDADVSEEKNAADTLLDERQFVARVLAVV